MSSRGEPTVTVTGPTGAGTYNIIVVERNVVHAMSLSPKAIDKLAFQLKALAENLSRGEEGKGE